MTERRTRRSRMESVALHYLLSAVKERSSVTSIAIIDSRGRVISGMGTARELSILGAIAAPVAAGTVDAKCERLTAGTDIIAKAMPLRGGTMYLAALGTRIGRMHDATKGIERILNRVA